MLFDDFLKFVLIIINSHLRYVEVSWRSREAISGHISHFRPLPAKWSAIMRIIKNQPKSPKSRFWPKNSNFFKVAGSVRKMDIWPEMGPWGVLEPFCTRNRYLKSFRSNFKSFLKNRFIWLFHMWDHPKYDRRIFYGPGKSDIEISTGPKTSKLFPPQKNGASSYGVITNLP